MLAEGLLEAGDCSIWMIVDFWIHYHCDWSAVQVQERRRHWMTLLMQNWAGFKSAGKKKQN